jgi:uncharacterized HAD superfamily protein
MGLRLRIGLDVDDVTIDFIHAFIKEAEPFLGVKFDHLPRMWDCSDCGITQAEKDRVIQHLTSIRNWYMRATEALPGVKELMPRLSALNDLFFITARIETAGIQTLKQTQMQLASLGIPYPTVLIAKSKGPLVRALALDAFIDDKPENLSDIERTPGIKPIKLYLMDQPWNQHCTSFIRVKSFQDFVKHIENERQTRN